MRKFLVPLALTLTTALAPVTLASPAQDLYDQASFYIEFYYNGPSTANLKELTQRFQGTLNQACAAERDTCPYDKAVPVIEQMIAELRDGHTFYQTPEDLGRRVGERQGQIPSEVLRIGLSHGPIQGSRDRLVLDVIAGAPADEAGFLFGDRITAINDRQLSSFASDDEVVAFLNTQVQSGRPVKVAVVRGPQRERLELSLTGRTINQARLPSMRIRPDGIAVLKIPNFDAQGQVGSRVHALVKQAQEKSAKGIILDLRDNSGGLAVEALISMAAFVDNPSVVFTDRYNVQRTEYLIDTSGRVTLRNREGANLQSATVPGYTRWRGPLAVLVDGGTASGGEYLAAAIQRAKGGPVIGETTFGIGNTTTRPFDLINGGAINISFNRATFSGGDGYPPAVRPDLEVKTDLQILADQGRDLPLEKALESMGIKSASR